jgi:CDP-glycerol glycerophosphotransferase (TagB/SpsB family)
VLAAGGDPGRLRATLDSVRDQPSPSIEILVLGRTHDLAVLRAMAGEDTRVRFLTAGSVHAARQRGVRRARGGHVLLATPGDSYLPGVLAELATALDDESVLCLFGGRFRGRFFTLADRPLLAGAPYLGLLILPRAWATEAVATPDDDPDGMLTALRLLRRKTRLAGYMAYKSLRAEPPGPFTARIDPFPGLGGHVARDLATLDALADLPEARKYRAVGALKPLVPYLDAVETASEDDWAVLAVHAADLRDAAGDLLQQAGVRNRVLTHLAANGLRDELVRFAEEIGADYPTTVREGHLIAEIDDPAGVLDPRDLVVSHVESRLEAQVRRLVVNGSVLELELFVGIRHVDQRPDDVVTVTLLDGARAEHPMRVTTSSDASVTRWMDRSEHDHAAGVVHAEIDVSALPRKVLTIAVTWQGSGLERSSVATTVSPRTSAVRWPVPLDADRCAVLDLRHGVLGLAVIGREVQRPAPVRRVEITDEALRLTVDAAADRVWLKGEGHVVEGIPGARGFWSIPLSDDRWGLGTTPLPTGVYQLELAGAGNRINGRMDPALLDRVDYTVCTAQHRVTVERRVGDQVGVRLGPLLTDDELGHRAQTLLQREFSISETPLDPRLVYFQSFTGQWANDNPLAIQAELYRRRQDLDLRWVVADSSATVPEGCTPLLFRSREWYDVMTRASYLVTNIELEKWFARRPGQQVLQTFHGYPSKAMGLGLWRPRGLTPRQIESQLDHTSRVWNTLVTPTEEMDQYYRRDYAYDGTILPVGYPRNDVLATEAADRLRAETRERLGIRPDQHAILYAPTWRDDRATNFRAAEAVDHLHAGAAAMTLGDRYILLMRGHRFHAPTDGRGGVVDVTSYPDINHLIAASDAAVLDYSSLRFDFALTGRPMVFLVPDLDAYDGRVRGFLWDYRETAPGPLVSTTAEVLLMLSDLDSLSARYAPDLAEFNARYNAHHDGHASERVVSAFFADLLT